MIDLTNYVALVTGATGGIGGGIAKMLYDAGATVALSGTRVEVLNELAATLGDRAHVFACNLSDQASVEALVPAVEGKLGKLDILVNNAGITKDGLILRMKDEDWQSVIDVNLGATFRLSKAAVKGMMKRRFGRIINITSIVGVTGNPGQANYCAAKAGIIGLSKSLAQEVASRNITVNCVAPGFISSAMTDALSEELHQKMIQNIPQGRMGTPEDIAFAVMVLAAPQASYITGQTIHVNGGMAMI